MPERKRAPISGDPGQCLGQLRQVVAEVATGAERVVDAGDDGHPRVGVVAESLPGVGQGVEVLEVEGVAPGGRSMVIVTTWSSAPPDGGV